MKEKGIFCLEGLWNADLRKRSSVQPILELLEKNSSIPYIYADCATVPEFEFYLKKWQQKKYSDYPILYLAFHGSLEEISGMLQAKCENRIILFASCGTINIDLRQLKSFLKNTNALAICGYKLVVPWIHSTALELMILSELQNNSFDGRGLSSIESRLTRISGLFEDLEFRIVTRKELK